MSELLAPAALSAHDRIPFSLTVNGSLHRQGSSGDMIYGIPALPAFLADPYGLPEGSLVFTGLPEGVGELHSGDRLQLSLHGHIDCGFEVA